MGTRFKQRAVPRASPQPSVALSRFQNPIANGQHLDSTKKDIQTMKRRSHVLHKLLQGFVQRKDQRLLQHMLPPKSVYVISVRLSPLQRRLYQRLLDAIPSKQGKHGKNYLFQAYRSLTKVRVRKVSFPPGFKGGKV
jgi:transcriptional regulator ATRX